MKKHTKEISEYNASKEFDFFRAIENGIETVFFIIILYIITSFKIFFYKKEFCVSLFDKGTNKIINPYTYLFISASLFVLIVKEIPPNFENEFLGFLNKLVSANYIINLSVESVIKSGSLIIFISCISGFFLEHILSMRYKLSSKYEYLRVFLYGLSNSIFWLLIFLFIFAPLFRYSFKIYYTNKIESYIISAGCLLVFVYSVFISPALLHVVHIKNNVRKLSKIAATFLCIFLVIYYYSVIRAIDFSVKQSNLIKKVEVNSVEARFLEIIDIENHMLADKKYIFKSAVLIRNGLDEPVVFSNVYHPADIVLKNNPDKPFNVKTVVEGYLRFVDPQTKKPFNLLIKPKDTFVAEAEMFFLTSEKLNLEHLLQIRELKDILIDFNFRTIEGKFLRFENITIRLIS